MIHNKHIFQIVQWALLIAISPSCNTTKMTTAVEKYNNGEFFAASQDFKKLYRKTDSRKERKEKGEIAWYLGNCYDRLMTWSQAGLYFRNAQRFGYEDASLEERIDDCDQKAGKHRSNAPESRYEIRRFNIVNSRRAEFCPSVWGDDSELYYTTSNDKATGEETSKITGTKYCDIWVTKKDENGVWQKPQSIGEAVNTKFDEGTPCFSPDGNIMYYTSSGAEEGIASSPVICYSRRTDASWSKGQRLHISNDTISVFAHPAVSPDGIFLYFASNTVGGQGGTDIWRASISGDKVAYIENLGDKVNSNADEMFPSVSPDGTLYFSSNRPGGFGALDIYAAREDEWGVWHVEHLGSPINSPADDFGMTFLHSTKEEQEGWFSSNRNSAKGYDNIYSFVLPSIKVRISGFVYDTEGNALSEAIVRIVGRNGMNFKSLTKPDGSYSVDIDRSTEYVMMSGKNGYLNRKAQFTSDGEEEDADYEVDFFLPSVTVPVLVDNVFYDYNQASLREESYPALDNLYQVLIDNPYTQIELSAHTDRIGSQEFNIQLSQRRAQSVCEYLISKGIDPQRLVPVGYGKEVPKTVDEAIARQYNWPVGQLLDETFIETLDEEQKKYADQINRRTEFKVLTTTLGLQ